MFTSVNLCLRSINPVLRTWTYVYEREPMITIDKPGFTNVNVCLRAWTYVHGRKHRFTVVNPCSNPKFIVDLIILVYQPYRKPWFTFDKLGFSIGLRFSVVNLCLRTWTYDNERELAFTSVNYGLRRYPMFSLEISLIPVFRPLTWVHVIIGQLSYTSRP